MKIFLTLILTLVATSCLAGEPYDEAYGRDQWRINHMIKCGEDTLKKWDCGQNCDATRGRYTFLNLKIYDTEVGKFSWATFNDTVRDQMVVQFRGTEGTVELIIEISQGENMDYTTHDIPGAQVTKFFQNHYVNQFRDDIIKEVENYLKEHPNNPVVFSGHSLGAALATLAAVDLVMLGKINPNTTSLYTYGSPRVGNWAFATKTVELIPTIWRVVNYRDTIPHVPTCMRNLENKCVTGNDTKESNVTDTLFWYAYHNWNVIYYEKDFKTYRTCTTGENNDCGDQWYLIGTDPEYHLNYYGIPRTCSGTKENQEENRAFKFFRGLLD